MDPETQKPIVQDGQAMLEQLGYKQELHRSYSIWSLAAFGIITLTPPTAIMNTLTTPLSTGGAQALVWGYIIVAIFTFLVALSMAEIAAVYPVSGGPLSWAYQLGGSKNMKILASWYTGYFNIFAQIAFAASAAFQGVVMIISAAALQHPTFVPERYHYVLVSIGFIFLFTCSNIFANRYHSNSTVPLMVYNVGAIVAIMITLLVTAPKRNDAKFIFTEYTNMTGFSSHGYVFILGLLQSAYTFTGYDCVTHLAEEANTDTYNVIPKALMTVITTCIIYGFVFVVVICSVLTNIPDLVESPTGSAFTQLVYNCVQNTPATVFIILLPALAALFAAETMTLANSRTIYSFARDGAFIFPTFFAKVSNKWGVPIPALLFSMVIQCIIVILYLSSDVVFNTILSLCTIGHELAYLAPIALMLFGGRSRMPKNRPWNLGKLGVAANAISVLWLLFVSITMFFPTVSPVTAGNMNYTVVIMFIVIAYASFCWFVQGKKTYKGPSEVLEEGTLELDGVSDDVVEVSASNESKLLKQ
jgi:amino acid transporter